ncbi:glycosyltransferase [Aquihabitans sp. G128]|uniref:glycosyltransferase n=1 Tax=Aquihabitans sp. G128 TaxID=2849779 RepID=UPI001C246240|nr:glycosyltransferase [Aquihabitans sp. G128]QXC60275.1 glycosyltransferase [Aquihabitans sp. G128]
MTDSAATIDPAVAPRPGSSVTVALCTWNGAAWLPDLLASLVAQDRPPDELVVQDDRSTDATVDLVRAFAEDAPFPVLLEVNDHQVGSTANFELALQRSSGRIVALADQDDVWYPAKLAHLVDLLDQDPILTLVFSDADLLGADGRPIGRRLWDSRGIGRYLRTNEIVPGPMFARRALSTGCTMAVRRRAVDAALPFPTSLEDPVAPMRHDRWLSLVAAAVGTVQAVPEPLLGFRVHPAQQTGVLEPAELRRRRLRAAREAFGPAQESTVREHRVRAEQLAEAARRADLLGDFEEADELEAISRHHRVRADRDAPPGEPPAHDRRRGPLRRLRPLTDRLRRSRRRRRPLGARRDRGEAVTAVRPTRVLAVTDTLEVGGAERVAVDIANSLDRRTHEVAFCATRNDGPLHDVLRDDVAVEVIGRRATWDVAGLVRFARFVRRSDIDVIHTHGRGTMKIVALCRQTGLLDTPHVFHDHYGRLHLDRRAGADLRKAMRIGVDEYLGVDSRLCRWARTAIGMPADRVHLARSGVDLRRFDDVEPVDLRAAFDLQGTEVVLAMVANFRQQKDHPTALRALAELPPDQRRRIGLVFIGSTSAERAFYERCMAMVEALGVGDQVRIAGALDEPLRYLAGADGAFLASKNETGPLVVLEYMASGLPFVASDTGEIMTAVRDLDVGFAPVPRDPHEFAAALQQVLDLGPDGRRAMGDRGRAAARDVFGQELVTRRVEEVYHQLLIRPSDGGPGAGEGPRSAFRRDRGAVG